VASADLARLVEDLERHLGDPRDPESPMSFARVLDLDEREEYPHEFVAVAQRWGAHEFTIPAAQGGKAVDVVDGFNLMRMVARRDPTTTTALILSSIGFMPIWVAGSDEQRQYFADGMKGGLKMAWGLSERAHGSDILADETVAERVDGGYLLSGEKWTIGNATLADVVMVFARTNPKGGPGGYSIFALEKRRVPAGSIEPLPNERIHGLRGLDMSGVRLDGCFVPESALIGGEGQGLEIALKSSQMVRTTINLLALGCADTALRVTLDFATEREIFGQRLVEIPYSRRQLVECFADVLVADALVTGAVRSLQVSPGQSSIFSSIAKYFGPTLLAATMGQLAVVLGARHYLRGHPRYGIFQKLIRDLPVSNFADGNTVVNLKNVALALEALLANATEPPPGLREEAVARASVIFDLDAELPPYRPWEQELFSRGADDVLLALPDSLAALRELAGREDGQEAEWLGRAADVGERLSDEIVRMRAEHERNKASLGKAYAQSSELFDLAKQYCAVNAAAACIHLSVHSRHVLPEPFPSGAVLLVCLERLWNLFHPTERVADAAVVDAAAEVLEQLHRENRLFCHLAFRLAGSPVLARTEV
jgi:alkylation response protein AidB-like acyl-CoA dehydrogenase